MVWYNPRTWGRGKQSEDSALELKCANPQCRRVINEDEVAYAPEFKEFYHIGSCPILASAYRVIKTGKADVVEDLQYLPREEALDILRRGRTNASS